MNPEIRFRCTPEEHADISAHVKAKHKWKRNGDFARYAVFTVMEWSKAGKHKRTRAEASAKPLGPPYDV